MSNRELIDEISSRKEPMIRGSDRFFSISNTESIYRDIRLFDYQDECVRTVLQHENINGIIHIPTGGGKTAIAIDIINRKLRKNNNSKFLWITRGNTLIRQSMVRLIEVGHIFCREIKIHWLKNDSWDHMISDTDVVFSTVNSLHWFYYYNRHLSQWRNNNDGLTIIFDEVHHAGARTYYDKLIEIINRSNKILNRNPQIIGLSATPIPNDIDNQNNVKNLFPVPNYPSTEKKDWEVMVFKSIEISQLQTRGILCPININDSINNLFEIPYHLLKSVIKDHQYEMHGGIDLYEKINTKVMSDPRILDFLAEKVKDHHEWLGKTIIFLPTVNAARALFSRLTKFPDLFGFIGIVHSGLDTDNDHINSDCEADLPSNEVMIREFIKKEKAIMLNVNMLTTGFDDPTVRTIIIAKAVRSPITYWQMIGRAMRGIRVNGTPFCNVIDPTHLIENFGLTGFHPINIRNGISTTLPQGTPKETQVRTVNVRVLFMKDEIMAANAFVGRVINNSTINHTTIKLPENALVFTPESMNQTKLENKIISEFSYEGIKEDFFEGCKRFVDKVKEFVKDTKGEIEKAIFEQIIPIKDDMFSFQNFLIDLSMIVKNKIVTVEEFLEVKRLHL